MRKLGWVLGMAFAMAMGAASHAGDMDVQALQKIVLEQQKALSEQNARMAAQDARLSDLQAKMADDRGGGGKATGVVSIKKNAAVTIGGQLNTRYASSVGSVKSEGYSQTAGAVNKDLSGAAIRDGSGFAKRSDYKTGNLHVSDAKLSFKIDVNDYFDAYLQLDVQHDTNRVNNTAGVAQKYWVRWKNLCNTGFGVLIGRGDFVFTDRYNVGQYTGLLGKQDDFAAAFKPAGIPMNGWSGGNAGEGMFSHRDDVLTPNHVGWDYSRTTQINPYWELMDGALRFDLSLIQSAERMTGSSNTLGAAVHDGVSRYRSINYGLGSGTFRVMWKPIEGLAITGSVANFYQANAHSGSTNRWDARRGTSAWAQGHNEWISRNATATNLAVRWNPAFAKAWNFWGKWTHGWNDGWTKDLDSDAVNFGASFSWADRWTYFAQADLFWNKNGRDVVEQWYKAQVWAFYTGFQYRLPYGVNMELGWRHEDYAYKNRDGYKHTKAKIDTFYGHVGFDF